MDIGGYRLDLINDGLFELRPESFIRLDTKELPHVRRRLRVAFNCLVIRGHGHTVVVDPGSGDKPNTEHVHDYHMEWPRKFFPALDDLGIRAEEVDTVILTHLHWDHCGGATSLSADGKAVPVFFNARHYLQVRELDAARATAASGDDSVLPDDYEPLQAAGLLDLVDGDAEILPGISVKWTGGHSPGHQIVVIGEQGGPRAVYLSDLVPTVSQIPFESIMSYDANVHELLPAKRRVLTEAVEYGDLLMFVHAPRQRAGYLKRQQDGELVLESVQF